MTLIVRNDIEFFRHINFVIRVDPAAVFKTLISLAVNIT